MGGIPKGCTSTPRRRFRVYQVTLTTNERELAMQALRIAFIFVLLSILAASGCFGQGGYGSTFAFDVAIPIGSFEKSFKTGYGGEKMSTSHSRFIQNAFRT